MNSTVQSIPASSAVRTGILDVCLLAVACLVPTVSHLVSYPLHNFDPMRVILLTGLLISGNRKNAYAMAVALPLFSFLVSGHPVFPKNVAIIAELLANVALFAFLSERMKSRFGAMFIAILCSKCLYYGLKVLLVSTGLLAGGIVATNLWIQLAIALVISYVFGLSKTSKLF